MTKLCDYINENIQKTVRNNKEGDSSLIGLPYPYTVPCMENIFNELYYWDTYFTNKGLIALGQTQLAKFNTLNVLFLVDKFGYMPNGNRIHFLGGSQPPYLAFMVSDIYEATKDRDFLSQAYPTVKKEYAFWMERRISDNGLNHFDTNRDKSTFAPLYLDYVSTRIDIDRSRDYDYAGRNYWAEGESGWDYTPRYNGYCVEFNPIDLNSNLYFYEKFFAFCEKELCLVGGEKWNEIAQKRAILIDKYLWNAEKGFYCDYNYVKGYCSGVASAAALQPYFVGLAPKNKAEGAKRVYDKISGEYGLFATEKTDGQFQWAYPNVWAPLQLIGVKSLKDYGFDCESAAVSKGYRQIVEQNFNIHGKLYEKYNGLSGGANAVSEYDTPEMLGWTAGVYIYLHKNYS